MRRLKFLYLEGTRVLLGVVFFTAGMSKLMPFPGLIGPQWLEARLEPYGLALFARYIAFAQILVGLLLLTRRFATLGAVMLFPLILSILMVTISLHWPGTPYINTVLLALNISLLAADFHRLKFMLFDNVTELKPLKVSRNNIRHDYIWMAAVVIFFLGLLGVNYTPAHKILLWTGGLTFIVLGIITVFYKLRDQKKA